MPSYYDKKRGKFPFAQKHADKLFTYDLSENRFEAVINGDSFIRRSMCFSSFASKAIDKPDTIHYHYFEENNYEYQYSFYFDSKRKQLTTNYPIQLVGVKNWYAYSIKGEN